jgi:hypothetical protein
MPMPSPVRDASRFLARIAEFTPREWLAVVAAGTADAAHAAHARDAGRDVASALRALALPGRREAHVVLGEWLDVVTTALLATPAAGEPALGAVDAMTAAALAERAVVALLASDALDQRAFDRLYAPFAAVVPVAALRAGARPEHGRAPPTGRPGR